MPSEHFATIFQRDLDRLDGLADHEWIPRAAAHRRMTWGGVVASAAIAVVVAVVALSAQAAREAQLTQDDAAATSSPDFVLGSQGAAGPSPSASPVASSNAWLTAAPTCPPGRILALDITQPPPPGSVPGTGATGPEEAFRKSYPTVTEFKMFPMGGSSVWIVAGGQTYIAYRVGSPGNYDWFAYPAKVIECRTPTNPRTAPPTTPQPGGSPSSGPKTVG
ncbi:MAG TPA: hypothetical protein VGR85_00240 [Candidatus Limnocylindria bacterium]|jgi:hypothetical protein|nr:hypothetical protein [Candidatus Limnocylindria bacterium]